MENWHMKNRMFHWRKEVATQPYPAICPSSTDHRKQSWATLLLSILRPLRGPWSWSWRGQDDLRAQPPALTLAYGPTGKHRLFFLFLALLFPTVSVCSCSTYNPFSLPRFPLSSCGDGPRNLTGTPPLEEPSTAALVGSILWIASRDRIARVSWFGRLGWFLILGRGGIRKAKSGAAAAAAAAGVLFVNLCT